MHVCDADAAALEALGKSDPAVARSRADVSDRAQVARMFGEAMG